MASSCLPNGSLNNMVDGEDVDILISQLSSTKVNLTVSLLYDITIHFVNTKSSASAASEVALDREREIYIETRQP